MTIPFGLGARRIVRQAALCCALGTVPPMLSAAFAAQKAPERPAAAKAPAAVQACVQCHGAEGEGQPGSGFPRLAGQGKQYLVKQLQDFRSGRRESPIMQPIAKALDDPAIESVSAYYQSVAAARPALSASAEARCDRQARSSRPTATGTRTCRPVFRATGQTARASHRISRRSRSRTQPIPLLSFARGSPAPG